MIFWRVSAAAGQPLLVSHSLGVFRVDPDDPDATPTPLGLSSSRREPHELESAG